MSDVLVFVGIVALMVVTGILVGIIVAGRIDRITAPSPAAAGRSRVTGDATTDAEEEQA